MGSILVDLLPAFIGALVALILKPLTEFLYSRWSETRAYHAHTADRIRDFRESAAVLESILLEYESKKGIYPVDNHIAKVQIPESISTVNAVDLFALSDSFHADALEISNILFNISRDAESILASKRLAEKGYESFMRQCWELSDKLRNLAVKFEEDFPKAARIHRAKGTSEKKKRILWEDGTQTEGIAYCDSKDHRIIALGEKWRSWKLTERNWKFWRIPRKSRR